MLASLGQLEVTTGSIRRGLSVRAKPLMNPFKISEHTGACDKFKVYDT